VAVVHIGEKWDASPAYDGTLQYTAVVSASYTSKTNSEPNF